MRYPGPHRHEHRLRWALLGVGLIIFVFGLLAAVHKEQRLHSILATPSKAVIVAATPAPTISPALVTKLRLFDGLTQKPLIGQSIVFISGVDCSASSACPTSSPIVLTADATGRVSVAQSLIRSKPKIYAAGYKLDNYFAFLKVEEPNTLTLYKALDGTKLSYDLTVDEVPIGLLPVK